MRYSLEIENLCDVCKFTYKCERYNKITETMQKLESTLLTKYKMDLTTGFAVEDCDTFKFNQSAEAYKFTIYNDEPPDNGMED